LAILAEEDSYGYAILQRVRELSGGRMEWTDGMLYPVLHRLERFGHIEARWEVAESGRRRKYYRITSQGQARLAEEREQWQAVNSTLQGIWRALSIPGPANRGISYHSTGRLTCRLHVTRYPSRSRSTNGGIASAADRQSTCR
jgi:hypothetical protein